jgi:putative spermidine/putrescine transport system permease protein
MKQRNVLGRMSIILFLVYMFLPILATYVFSIAIRWDRSILPEGLTFEWYQTAFQDRWFLIVFRHSITISAITVLVSTLLIVPTAYWVHLRLPRALPLLNLITTLPFAIPAVVLALGLIKLYGQGPLQLARTPPMLVLAYVIFTLPFMYRPVASSLEAIDIRRLTEAAQSLGASWPRTMLQVIFPNIMPGILSGGLLVFATIFGEFTLATLLVGARYKTFPMQLVYYTRRDGRIASAYSVISFTVAWATSLIILWITTWGTRRTSGSRSAGERLGQQAPVGGKV